VAREGLSAALACLAESDLTESDDESDQTVATAVVPIQQQTQQQTPSPTNELHLTWDRSTGITGMCLAPATDPNSKAGNLWVGLSKRLEIYMNCNPGSKQEVPLQHKVS
jgi:hypothetical protein